MRYSNPKNPARLLSPATSSACSKPSFPSASSAPALSMNLWGRRCIEISAEGRKQEAVELKNNLSIFYEFLKDKAFILLSLIILPEKKEDKMLKLKQYEKELIKVVDKLPEDKVIEVIDFAKFLKSQNPGTSKSQIDESSLILQQRSLGKIWDSPEEDIYDL